jgi:SAM-dependent methyltransferase
VDELNLLIDLHTEGPRQGPGGDYETRLAVALSGLKGQADLTIADIGCGTGASTLVLASELDAYITAVDLFPEFLRKLEEAAEHAGLADRITVLSASMQALPFAEAAYDAIWSEGAIYNMGFAAGVEAWSKHLKPGGILAVSELTWLTDQRPGELQAHWQKEYPEVDTAAGKMAVLERLGFSLIGYFPLPVRCWLDNYYRPMQRRFADFLDRHENSQAARAIVLAEENEIALYERHRAFVSYGYYIGRKGYTASWSGEATRAVRAQALTAGTRSPDPRHTGRTA